MLTVLAYITFVFFGMRFMVAFSNILFSPVLKRQKQQGKPLVSVLIPARNEEQNLGNILNDLQNQSYLNIEVIIFNDQSTDQTEEIVEAFIKEDKRFHLINTEGLPDGWLGKIKCLFSTGQTSKGRIFFIS
jgi:cellulose synthase/poly-beta-1,6-N-acetylglucosamine synthase-like glycosyltransferase